MSQSRIKLNDFEELPLFLSTQRNFVTRNIELNYLMIDLIKFIIETSHAIRRSQHESITMTIYVAHSLYSFVSKKESTCEVIT